MARQVVPWAWVTAHRSRTICICIGLCLFEMISMASSNKARRLPTGTLDDMVCWVASQAAVMSAVMAEGAMQVQIRRGENLTIAFLQRWSIRFL